MEYIVLWDRGGIQHTMTFFCLVDAERLMYEFDLLEISYRLSIIGGMLPYGIDFWLDIE